MRSIEVLGIVAVAIVMVMIMYQAVAAALSYRMIEEAELKIRLRKKGTIHRYVWICISLTGIIMNVVNIGKALDRGDTGTASGFLYFSAAWVLMLILWLFIAIFCRSSYISPERILTLSGSKRSMCADNVSYNLSGDILEIYCGDSNSARKYEIEESREKLVPLLEKSYRKRTSE